MFCCCYCLIYNGKHMILILVLDPSSVNFLKMLDRTANTASVEWQDPCYINDNSVNYSIKLTNKTSSDRENTSFETYDETTNLQSELTRLLPFRNYTVQVAPVNSVGKGPYQDLSFQTHISGISHNCYIKAA